jgi:hypothetical protein
MVNITKRILVPEAKAHDNSSQTPRKLWQLFTAQRRLKSGSSIAFPSEAEGDAARQEVERMLLRRIWMRWDRLRQSQTVSLQELIRNLGNNACTNRAATFADGQVQHPFSMAIGVMSSTSNQMFRRATPFPCLRAAGVSSFQMLRLVLLWWRYDHAWHPVAGKRPYSIALAAVNSRLIANQCMGVGVTSIDVRFLLLRAGRRLWALDLRYCATHACPRLFFRGEHWRWWQGKKQDRQGGADDARFM